MGTWILASSFLVSVCFISTINIIIIHLYNTILGPAGIIFKNQK